MGALAVVLLVIALGCAVVRPWGWTEAVVAVPAAALMIAVGALPLKHAVEEVVRLGPVVGFLAAVLVLAHLVDREGVFRACGAWMARTATGPRRLLVQVFVLASVTTAVLSLDATVVLLTPVVLATAARAGARSRPHVYASAHLANSASLLLPVSNLTNLLAFETSGLSFTRFVALMTLPWLTAIAVEYAVFRRHYAEELDLPASAPETGPPPAVPVFALVTVAATLVGFVATSALGVGPAWAAFAGAVVLGVRGLVRGSTTSRAVLGAVSLPFLVFVLALGILVRAALDNGLGVLLGPLVPDGSGLLALLGLAALAAVLANVFNNLPAVLVLLPLTASAGPSAVLAVLIGVNIGPNLTYAGSLATLLWRRVVRAHGEEVELREFTRLGLWTVPLTLVAAVVALWLSLMAIGTG